MLSHSGARCQNSKDPAHYAAAFGEVRSFFRSSSAASPPFVRCCCRSANACLQPIPLVRADGQHAPVLLGELGRDFVTASVPDHCSNSRASLRHPAILRSPVHVFLEQSRGRPACSVGASLARPSSVLAPVSCAAPGTLAPAGLAHRSHGCASRLSVLERTLHHSHHVGWPAQPTHAPPLAHFPLSFAAGLLLLDRRRRCWCHEPQPCGRPPALAT